MEEKKYQINNKTYIQRPLVLGQVRQLLSCLKGVELPESLNPLTIATALGDRLARTLMVLIFEEGKSPKRTDKELSELAEEIEFQMALEIVMEIIVDFFECTTVSALLNSLSRITGQASKDLKSSIEAP